ncbi:MAG TPA: UDP-N-acetylmuramate dehydrogenase [Planctomycetota bacterium]|nr:UDP-N-acetylmuramate dehydrogenase [Planctomycetota bacterium]
MDWTEPFTAGLRRDVPLAPFTTVGLGGPARWFFEPADAVEVAAFLRAARAAGVRTLVLGAGANLLVADGGVDAAVIHPARLDRIEIDGDRVRAGAGVSLTELIARTTDAGLGGLETLAGIPAQIGGAIAMNAGGRWGSISRSTVEVELATSDGRVETAPAEALRFSYRKAAIPPGAVVTGATFRLVPGDRRELKKAAGRILKEKNAAQPTTGANFGCAFVNPEGASAGKLVEAAGLKGTVRGGARVSPLHGNFVENLGSASADDVRGLLEMIEKTVFERFGVRLEREVRCWP